MNFIELQGCDIKQDVEIIKRAIDADKNVVFVYTGSGALYDYIDNLNDKGRGLDDDYLYKFKVCYERKDLQISFGFSEQDAKRITSMSDLLKELDGKKPCRIVVENDDRVQLAFIMQQLIFVEYPGDKVDILIRSEARDADKINRFMEKVDKLLTECEEAIERLHKQREEVDSKTDLDGSTKSNMLKDIDDALSSCEAIKQQILKAKDVELKLAVAASKKAGKSVIVNCFIGEQIAPTSTELATPNNCIYKKSPDSLYHFQLEGGEEQKFEKRNDVYELIDRYFKKAQNSDGDGFACPDMHIGYVSAGNNFSSYTISDTAGPDAAGTKHAEVADRAMKQCDVAIFVIDYSKYLTVSEEAFLRDVKDKFTKQNKFHSLIFALNKIDVRFTDVNSPKSSVKSVDFLKTRLAKIDSAYRDCIIFPTCSLEYFNAIEVENAGIAELTNNDKMLPIGDMKRVTFAHKDVKALAWLHTLSDNLEYYHGIENVSCDFFKKDSGMTALMSHVSYVAQSKARHEIVNNVTFQIDTKRTEIQSILNYVSNIEKLIKADNDSIFRISDIINDYESAVNNILYSGFTQSDIAEIEYGKLLKTYYSSVRYDKQLSDPFSFIKDECVNRQMKALSSVYDQNALVDAIIERTFEAIWGKLLKAQNTRAREIEFQEKDFKDVVNMIIRDRLETGVSDTRKMIKLICEDVKSIVKKRHHSVKVESEECRKRLEKENIVLDLPQLPEFEFNTEMPSFSNYDVSIQNVEGGVGLYDRFSDEFVCFDSDFTFKNFMYFWIGLFDNKKWQETTVTVTQERKSAYRESFDKGMRKDLERACYRSKLDRQVEALLTELVKDKDIPKLISSIKKAFDSVNKSYKECAKRFKSAVDDRAKYLDRIDDLNQWKANSESIREYTSAFMGTWNYVINALVNEECGDEKAVAAD